MSTAPQLRVSDAERNDVIAQLSHHTGAGRLTLDEFDDRVSDVLRAQTADELTAAVHDLPASEDVVTSRRTSVHLMALAALLAVALVTSPWILVFAPLVALCYASALQRARRAGSPPSRE